MLCVKCKIFIYVRFWGGVRDAVHVLQYIIWRAIHIYMVSFCWHNIYICFMCVFLCGFFFVFVQTCYCNFGWPLAGAIQNALLHRFHMARMTLFLDTEDISVGGGCADTHTHIRRDLWGFFMSFFCFYQFFSIRERVGLWYLANRSGFVGFWDDMINGPLGLRFKLRLYIGNFLNL